MSVLDGVMPMGVTAPPPGPLSMGPPSPPRGPKAPVGAVEIVGAMRLIATMPANPMTRPAAPPIRPCTRDSPATCPTTRPLDHPIALSVPNSRVRRETPDIVNSTARTSATASTISDSHVPRLVMSADALESEPETVDARSDCELTVASGNSSSRAACTAEIASEDSACT